MMVTKRGINVTYDPDVALPHAALGLATLRNLLHLIARDHGKLSGAWAKDIRAQDRARAMTLIFAIRQIENTVPARARNRRAEVNR